MGRRNTSLNLVEMNFSHENERVHNILCSWNRRSIVHLVQSRRDFTNIINLKRYSGLNRPVFIELHSEVAHRLHGPVGDGEFHSHLVLFPRESAGDFHPLTLHGW